MDMRTTKCHAIETLARERAWNQTKGDKVHKAPS